MTHMEAHDAADKQKPFSVLRRKRLTNESPPRGIIHVRILLTVPFGAVTLYLSSVSQLLHILQLAGYN